ncbi:hypothetical protein C8A00DRAFT_16480 [Chaetomidium leptoderma]|uniref:Protein kinase domain-containing protein n=1 Tax=Chaetomidium leptoderma TaxID=669021 RepID=A0AAN6ZUA1_9PEZI|nr:hypothetical protein C8A00DRAFT_16480 [Chaetomidium leptoderma]
MALLFLGTQKRSNFRFEAYRRLGTQEADVDYDAPECRNFVLPKPGVYPGVQRPFNPPHPLWTHQYPTLNQHGAIRTPRAAPASVVTARKRLRRQVQSRQLTYSKDLGHGGNGLVVLFNWKNLSPPYHKKYLVAKCNHAGGQAAAAALLTEKLTTDKFRNARHIIQTDTPPGRVPNQRSSMRDRQRRGLQGPGGNWAPEQDDISDVMFLEHCKRGSLHKALYTSHAKILEFPNRALWHIFHCLIKACIAMAYPPTPPGNPGHGQQPRYKERVPDNENKSKFVHFDIDPQNSKHVAEPGLNNHPLIPVMKLSDFGIASDIQDQDLSDRDLMWQLRPLAKYGFFTPEQFTEEWDYVPAGQAPRAGNPPFPKVAGNFTWKNNLFQMGLVMVCLITRHRPATPPYPSRIRMPPIDPGDEDDDDIAHASEGARDNVRGDAADLRPNEPATHFDDMIEVEADWIRVWSYGGYILDDNNPVYNRVDRGLRHLVAQCLCDDPYYRPRLETLELDVRTCIKRKVWDRGQPNHLISPGNTDADVKEWVKECFDKPVVKPQA